VEHKLLPVPEALAVEPYILGLPIVAYGDTILERPAASQGTPRRRQPETPAPGGGNLLIHQTSEGSSIAEIVQGFEKIGLSLAVLADKKDPLGPGIHLAVFEIAE